MPRRVVHPRLTRARGGERVGCLFTDDVNCKNNGNVDAILNNRNHNRDFSYTYDELNRIATAQSLAARTAGGCSLALISGRICCPQSSPNAQRPS